MPIFRRYAEELLPKIPTVLRKMANNVLRLPLVVEMEALDKIAEALQQYVDAWPIDTAPGWLLDRHWLPYHNLQRNGMTDEQARQFIHAKRLLNKSWGAGDQVLQILKVFLPESSFAFSYFPPKAWTVQITGAQMVEAAQSLAFLRKGPSPAGGGFSVAGDNGMAIVQDKRVLSYKSVHGPVIVTGWYTSMHGVPPSDVAGHAHVAMI